MIATQGPDIWPGWMIALRDALLVFGLTFIPAVVLQAPESWSDLIAFEHVGIPILTAVEMFVVSLAVHYKVNLPTKPGG